MRSVNEEGCLARNAGWPGETLLHFRGKPLPLPNLSSLAAVSTDPTRLIALTSPQAHIHARSASASSDLASCFFLALIGRSAGPAIRPRVLIRKTMKNMFEELRN